MKEASGPSLFPGPTRVIRREAGILPSQEIQELIWNGKIRSRAEISDDQIQPASIDLRLGEVAYQVKASFLPRVATTSGFMSLPLRRSAFAGALTKGPESPDG